MRAIFQILLIALISLNCRAAVVPILRNTFTTNTFDAGLGGAIPYFDYPSGKFVVTPLAYTSGILFEPTLGFLQVFHTNTTGEVMLVLQEGGTAGPSIQAYSDRLVVANTNLSFDAVGPFGIQWRIDGSNVLQSAAGGVSISGKTNIVSDSGNALRYNGGSILQPFYYGGQFGFGSGDIIPTNVHASNLSSGITDLFTVPAGKRFFITAFTLSTTNQTTGTGYTLLKTNGGYFRLTADGANVKTNIPNTFGMTANGYGQLFEAGETFSVTNSQAGGNTWVGGILFPTNAPIWSPKLLSLATTNKTLYTCPAGKCAFNISFTNPGNSYGLVTVWNDSGSARTITAYVVPSGATADSSNQYVKGSVANKAFTQIIPGIMFPGDSIVIVSDASTDTQWATYTVAEIPFP